MTVLVIEGDFWDEAPKVENKSTQASRG